jgi:hypothetical protein
VPPIAGGRRDSRGLNQITIPSAVAMRRTDSAARRRTERAAGVRDPSGSAANAPELTPLNAEFAPWR